HRRAEARDHFAKARLPQRDRVNITFDHDRAIALRYRAARFEQSVNVTRLRIERGVGRIDVLRQSIVEHAPAESDRTSLAVADREYQPAAKHIVHTVAALLHQTGLESRLEQAALLERPRQRRRLWRRVTEHELARTVDADGAALQILARR